MTDTRIRLPGIGALVLDALTTGRFAEARAIAAEDPRVTIDRAPRDYLLVLWSTNDSEIKWLSDVPLGVATFAIDYVPAFCNVVLERDGQAARFEIVNTRGDVVHSSVIVGARGGSAGRVVTIEVAQRLRAAARELRYTLDEIERRSLAGPGGARIPFGTPRAVCGCVAGAPCALHRAYW